MCYDRFDTCKVQKPPVIYDRLHDRVGIAGMYSRENPTAGIYDTMGYGTVGAMLTVMCIFCMDRMDHACLACICHHLALYTNNIPKSYTMIVIFRTPSFVGITSVCAYLGTPLTHPATYQQPPLPLNPSISRLVVIAGLPVAIHVPPTDLTLSPDNTTKRPQWHIARDLCPWEAADDCL